MSDKHLKDLANEIESSLQRDSLTERDRVVLSELQAALATLEPAPHGLRERLTHAVERLEGEHPRLTALLSKTLDVLSDVGI
jgi:hypothetical protein